MKRGKMKPVLALAVVDGFDGTLMSHAGILPPGQALLHLAARIEALLPPEAK